MPTLYALKPAFQDLLRPAVSRAAALGVTPNHITLAACLLSLALGLDLALGHRLWLLLPIFLPIRMALNAADGLLAREHNMQTPFGAVLNELADAISDAALTLPFAYVADPLAVGSAIVAALLTEIAGIAGEPGERYHRRYQGPFGKSDRALALGFFGAWLALGWPVAAWASHSLPYLWTALCGLTIWNRSKR